jgi:uncharacterized protein (TIGR00296 family)
MHPPSNPEPASQLAISERRELLARARQAIIEAVVHHRIPDIPPSSNGALSDHRGVFVSLYRRGRLRGCVGQTKSGLPLAETVAQCSISAALSDPRFAPLKSEEVDELTIEISVLSEPQPIPWQAIEDGSAPEIRERRFEISNELETGRRLKMGKRFEVGKQGLLVVRGVQRGLLLPQVARERHWPAKRFVEEVCRKAGLEPGAWRGHETQIFAFTVEAFSEAELQQAPTANYSIST